MSYAPSHAALATMNGELLSVDWLRGERALRVFAVYWRKQQNRAKVPLHLVRRLPKRLHSLQSMYYMHCIDDVNYAGVFVLLCNGQPEQIPHASVSSTLLQITSITPRTYCLIGST